MLSKLWTRLTYANVVATLALFIALGGSSYAALTITGKNVKNHSLSGTDIKKGSLTSREIRTHSLLAADFKSGQLSAGPQGSQGPKGDPGAPGAPGAPATKLFGNFDGDTGNLVRGSGVVSTEHPGDGFYVIKFNQSITNCAMLASPASKDSVNPSSRTVGVGYLGDHTMAFVLIRNDFNDTRTDADFSLAVFC